jgi:uncharacterized protein YceH (UPF0502 family)
MSDRRSRSDRGYRSGSRRPGSRRGRRTGLLDFWQNLMDDTYDFVDDTLYRVRDDDWDDDLENEVQELREAVAALHAKLDRLLSDSPSPALDVREATPAKSLAKT